MAQKKEGNEKKTGVKIQDLSPKKDAKGGRGITQQNSMTNQNSLGSQNSMGSQNSGGQQNSFRNSSTTDNAN